MYNYIKPRLRRKEFTFHLKISMDWGCWLSNGSSFHSCGLWSSFDTYIVCLFCTIWNSICLTFYLVETWEQSPNAWEGAGGI